MADNEDGEETSTRRNDWEVVSLTASAYAASSGAEETDPGEDENRNTYEIDNDEISHALFMSGHFVFPPSQHENLPLQPENNEILEEQRGNDGVTEPELEQTKFYAEDETERLLTTEDDEFPSIPIFDEKGNRIPLRAAHFEEAVNLQDLNFAEKEHNQGNVTPLSSLYGGGSYKENVISSEQVEPLSSLDRSTESSQCSKSIKDDNLGESDLPCGAWWKKRAISLYAHAKEASTFWSVFVAAAVMGLVILGQRWQQERWQILQMKWQHIVNDEKMSRMLAPLFRMRDVIVGGHRHGSLIRGSSSSGN